MRQGHVPLRRDPLGRRACRDGGRRGLVAAGLEAARSQDLLAESLKGGLAALGPARYERPAFSPLRRAAQTARAQGKHRDAPHGADVLTDLQRRPRPRRLSREERAATRAWQRLTQEPPPPTPTRRRAPVAPVQGLQALTTASQALEGVPATQRQRCAEAARAWQVARMNALPAPKR